MKKFTKVFALVLSIVMLVCSIPAFAADSKPVYVVLGDSIAAGTGLADKDNEAYGALVAKTNGYEYINYGVNGYTTGNMLNLLKKDNVRTDIARADFISISIGGNNYLQGGLLDLINDGSVKHDFTRFDEIIDTFSTQFAQMISEIRELNPDAVILMQTMYNPNYSVFRSTFQQATDRINNSVRTYLSENPGAFNIVDIASVFNGHFEWINADTIHPNASGHYQIAKAILEKLAELGYDSGELSSNSFFAKIANFFNMIFNYIKNLFA